MTDEVIIINKLEVETKKEYCQILAFRLMRFYIPLREVIKLEEFS